MLERTVRAWWKDNNGIRYLQLWQFLLSYKNTAANKNTRSVGWVHKKTWIYHAARVNTLFYLSIGPALKLKLATATVAEYKGLFVRVLSNDSLQGSVRREVGFILLHVVPAVQQDELVNGDKVFWKQICLKGVPYYSNTFLLTLTAVTMSFRSLDI